MGNDQFINRVCSHIDKFIREYGLDLRQLDILQEECAELIQAISKYKRVDLKAIDMITEEMAHVLISSIVVAKFIGIKKENILKEIEKKDQQLE